MTTYYVSSAGNDANNGLGPDASHASNKPWLTIGKALGASGISSGDTVYIAPGVYRETVTVAMASAVANTSVLGDPANARGFKDSLGVLLSAGDVQWTAYTTNDTSAPAAAQTLNLNGRDFLDFENLWIIGGNASTSCVSGTNCVDIIFRNILFQPLVNNAIATTVTVDAACNWVIDRCRFAGSMSGGAAIQVTMPTSTVADYDINFLIQNCIITGGCTNGIVITASGGNANKGGGVDMFYCTFWGRMTAVIVNSANVATSIPSNIYNSKMFCGNSTALSANTLGQIVEDNNLIQAGTARLNVSVGANSNSNLSLAPLMELGQSFVFGRETRPFLMPAANSPILGRGVTGGGPSVDIFNINRPAGGGSVSNGWGSMERHGTAARETSVVDAGSNAVKITGPGDHDLLIPVDAALTTITIRVRYDTNHGAGNKPQVTILNGEEVGVTTETKTATVGVDTWETITFTSFTPTAKGIVTLRLISRAAAGNGIAYFDTITGGAQGTQGLDYFRRGEPIPAAVATASAGAGTGGSHVLGGFVVR